jgi:cyclohexyl-isocyanide hydratase
MPSNGVQVEPGVLSVVVLVFPDFDQLDATGPFEVFAHLQNSRVLLVAEDMAPVRDIRGMRVLPDAALAEVSRADVVVVPGGAGQEALMENAAVLDWVNRIASGATLVMSVCTGALVLGAAGLLEGRRATTHWASHELLPYFGATPVRERVVTDGKLITSAGVSAGIDAALLAVAHLRGEATARAIQLGIEYAPEPPFVGGTPETTPAEVRARVEAAVSPLLERRRATALRVAARLASSRRS